VLSSAAEAELEVLFHNAKDAEALHLTLEDMRHTALIILTNYIV